MHNLFVFRKISWANLAFIDVSMIPINIELLYHKAVIRTIGRKSGSYGTTFSFIEICWSTLAFTIIYIYIYLYMCQALSRSHFYIIYSRSTNVYLYGVIWYLINFLLHIHYAKSGLISLYVQTPSKLKLYIYLYNLGLDACELFIDKCFVLLNNYMVGLS